MRQSSKKLLVAMVTSLLCVLFIGSPAFAALGKISGTVKDASSGEPLPGVNVQIAGTQMGAVTNVQGQYFILNVPPGNCTLKFSFMGYTSQEIQNVKAALDVTTTVDAALKQTMLQGEVVTVVAKQPPVDKSMTATKITFSDEVVNNVMPVNNLNEILQTSVTTQSMRGANKVGVGYMIDGVNVADIMFSTGGNTDGYTNVKRNQTPLTNTTGQYVNESAMDGRTANMVQTAVGIPQSSVAEVNVIAGTFNAEYSASGGVINIASKNGGRKYSGKINVRSSAGGLDHKGPNIYNNASSDPTIIQGKSIVDFYMAQKTRLAAGDSASKARSNMMDWTPDKYEYGDDPRQIAELYFGGPLTSRGNFFIAGNYLNDHGKFPGEFQRNLGLSLKLNYDVTNSDKLTAYGKMDDWGKLLGWYNRQYTYMYSFFLEGQPVNNTLGLISYLKHTHVFNSSSFLETTASYVSNDRTYGYRPVDDKLKYNEYGDEWLILDTVAEADKYIVNEKTRIFNYQPGNDPIYQVQGLENQIRYGLAGYHYESLKTNTMTLQTNFTRQMDYHHQLKSGVEYKYNTVDRYEHKSSVGHPDKRFPFETIIYKIHPWSFGSYVQDKVEYEGIIVNLGLRFDAYNWKTQLWNNYFQPVYWDTLDNTQRVMAQRFDKPSKTHSYFSPRIGVSHPITETAAMHYSWGIYSTPANLGQYLQSYGMFANASLPAIWNPDPEPEQSVAYEIGMNVALTNDFGADLTAYYRDVRNGSVIGYSISQDKAITKTDFSLYTYYTDWGYRDSRGLELNLWKRPNQNRYFGLLGLSGNLSVSYSYDKASAGGGGMSTESSLYNTSLSSAANANYNWDIRYVWPTYSRGYNDWNGKLSLLFDFPMDVKLASMATYRSPWRFNKTQNVTNQRYEEKLLGESFFQVDMRLTKYFGFGRYRAAIFAECLNIFDKENILTFDNYGDSNYYEKGRGPWGMFNRATDQYGSPLAGIAREIYAGVEFQF